MKNAFMFFQAFTLLIIASLFAYPAVASAETGATVLEKAHMFGENRYLDMKVRMEMEGGSTEKKREIDIKVNNEDGDYKIYMQITSPPFLRKMKFLQHQPKSGEPLQWIATSRGARKVTGSAEEEHIFDSDFTASDFAAITNRDYNIVSFSNVTNDGHPCYRLEIDPLDSDAEWHRKILYIDRRSFLIREVEYLNGGSVEKRYRLLSTRQIGDNTLPKESVMQDLRRGSSTRLEFIEIETPSSLPARIFHYRNL